ncbi:MAG: DUF4340 domain-containing protein [Ruminococcus sp.]
MNKKMLRTVLISAAALVVIVGIILAVVFVPSCADDGQQLPEIDYGVDIELSVNSDGLHTAQVQTNSKGEIENNSYGTLINYVPADIDKIVMNTEEGNYSFLSVTPTNADGSTEATVYTLEGFEDYDLVDANPSLLASAVCNIAFTKVIDLTGENADEYGFTNPRAEATVYYSDGTHSIVRLGDDAPGGTYCYIQFGDNDTVYLAATENMEPMLLSITELFSTSINGDATSVADDSFDRIILGGTHLDEEVVIKANSDETLSCYYVMSSHSNAPVNTVIGSNIVGSIKSLTAKEVVCVNPSDEQLKEYGLLSPYATVKTNYTYTESEYDSEGNETAKKEKTLSVSLLASEADSENCVYLMEEGGKLVYSISADSVAWATASMSDLKSEYVFYPSYSALSAVTVKASGSTYKFVLGTEEKTTTDDDGNSTTSQVVTVTLGNKKLDESQFYIFFEDLSMLTYAGEDQGNGKKGDMLTVTYSYKNGKADDTVVFCSTGTQKVLPEVNGSIRGYVYKDYVEDLCENVKLLAADKEITSVQ